jgi:hypothetical protein
VQFLAGVVVIALIAKIQDKIRLRAELYKVVVERVVIVQIRVSIAVQLSQRIFELIDSIEIVIVEDTKRF